MKCFLEATIALVILSSVVTEVASKRILFYVPYVAKSSAITIPPVANALADRGHDVTVASIWTSLPYSEDIQKIPVQSRFGSVFTGLSSKFLVKKPSKLDMIAGFGKMLEAGLETNTQALKTLKSCKTTSITDRIRIRSLRIFV